MVSIEGGKLFVGPSGVEMIVSTEKGIAYPEALGSFQKPGTGVWSIDRIGAASIESLDSATMIEVQSSGEGARCTSRIRWFSIRQPVERH